MEITSYGVNGPARPHHRMWHVPVGSWIEQSWTEGTQGPLGILILKSVTLWTKGIPTLDAGLWRGEWKACLNSGVATARPTPELLCNQVHLFPMLPKFELSFSSLWLQQSSNHSALKASWALSQTCHDPQSTEGKCWQVPGSRERLLRVGGMWQGQGWVLLGSTSTTILAPSPSWPCTCCTNLFLVVGVTGIADTPTQTTPQAQNCVVTGRSSFENIYTPFKISQDLHSYKLWFGLTFFSVFSLWIIAKI